MVVFGLGKEFFFESALGHCENSVIFRAAQNLVTLKAWTFWGFKKIWIRAKREKQNKIWRHKQFLESCKFWRHTCCCEMFFETLSLLKPKFNVKDSFRKT